jgi:O-antigen/teichoic acid export membrane protein
VTEPQPSRGADPSVAGSSLLLLVARVLGNSGFFVAILVVARALGPSGRGTIAFLTVLALILAHVATVGVPSATQVFAAQRVDARPRLLGNLLGLVVLASGSASGVVVALLLAFPDARPESLEGPVLALLVPGTIGIGLVEASYYYLAGCGKFGRQAAITATVPWAYAAGLGLVAATSGLTVFRAALAWTLATLVWAALLVGAAAVATGLARPSISLLAESARFGVRAWAGNLALFLTARLDQIVVGLIASEAVLGIYAIAVNVAEVALYVPAAAAMAFLPAIARTAAGGRTERALAAFRQLVLVTAGVVVLGALVGAPLLPLAFGEEFRASVAPFLWLLPGAVGYAGFQVFSSALLASDAPGRSSLSAVLALAVGLGLDFALIPRYGATGAAAAATASFFVGAVSAALTYRALSPFAWTELVPRRADAAAVAAFVGRLWTVRSRR